MRYSASALLLIMTTPNEGVGQNQNPSPMVEATRAHERLERVDLSGAADSIPGPGGRAVRIFVPNRGSARGPATLVVHFHGAAWIPEQSVAGLQSPAVSAVVNLGTGSGVYDRAFSDPQAFRQLVDSIARSASRLAGTSIRMDGIVLTAFSAGHGAVRAILRDSANFTRVAAILLLDGMHTSYVPERTVLADGGALDETNLVPFAEFGRAAVNGTKRLLITHSEIFPGTFASTTETAHWLLGDLGLARTAVLKWGPRGMQQLSEVSAGAFTLQGYAGNSAPDHVDHFHAMPELLATLLR
ncbi:hypothetical protein BH23GEM9_BH23GEM9_32840 [soil metagenome]